MAEAWGCVSVALGGFTASGLESSVKGSGISSRTPRAATREHPNPHASSKASCTRHYAP